MSASGPSTPSPWQQAWDAAQPRLRAIEDALPSSPAHPVAHVVRVGQVDAESLDEELVRLLQEPLIKAGNLLNSALRAKFEPELALFVRSVLYKFSVCTSGASYGARLQGLRYHVPCVQDRTLDHPALPRRTLAAHAALTIVTPYLYGRLRSYALSHAWPDTPSSDRRRKSWRLLAHLESAHTLLALLNFLAFLRNGRYRTLADRALSMQLVPAQRLSREVSYEFMNRQMVWHAFTEFLLFVLPLLNAPAVRRKIRSISTASKIMFSSWLSASASQSEEGLIQKRGKYHSLPVDQCAICADNASFNIPSSGTFELTALNDVGFSIDHSIGEESSQFPITTPYRASCGHIFCYYCMSEKLLHAVDDGDNGWGCLRCTESVRSLERVILGEEAQMAEWESDIDDLPSFASDMSLDSESDKSE